MSADNSRGDEAGASHSVLLHALTVLGTYMDGMVVIGGWVPEILFPGHGHSGSLDVDLAVDAKSIRPDAYKSIRMRLLDAGYLQSTPNAGVFTKAFLRNGQEFVVKLDLVAGEDAAGSAAVDSSQVQGLCLARLRGVGLAFGHATKVTLTGELPDGATNEVRARVVSVPAFLCMKAFAMNERDKPKDSYDVYFCMKHFPGGASGLAAAFRPLLMDPLGREAIEILRGKFQSIKHVGPLRAADFAAAQGGSHELVQRDAFEIASEFFRALNG